VDYRENCNVFVCSVQSCINIGKYMKFRPIVTYACETWVLKETKKKHTNGI
jgi:hypothetical protein